MVTAFAILAMFIMLDTHLYSYWSITGVTVLKYLHFPTLLHAAPEGKAWSLDFQYLPIVTLTFTQATCWLLNKHFQRQSKYRVLSLWLNPLSDWNHFECGVTCIGSKFGHQVVQLLLLPIFAPRWRYLHWLWIWPPGARWHYLHFLWIGLTSCTMAQLELVTILATRWRYLH